jgi:hypothetical protein
MVIELRKENEKRSNGNESMLNKSLRFLYLIRLASTTSMFLYLFRRVTAIMATKITKKMINVSKWAREKDASVL